MVFSLFCVISVQLRLVEEIVCLILYLSLDIYQEFVPFLAYFFVRVLLNAQLG